MAPPPLPELMEDSVGEILLRVPPDEPAHLFRAALVCKTWFRVLRDPGFLRRYREFHRAPPLLGILHPAGKAYRLAPTTSAAFALPAFLASCKRWWALDCRHGRVLLYSFGPVGISVWDPVTGDTHPLPAPPYPYVGHNAAVLCASDGCHHLDCHGKHFRVVFVGGTLDSTTTKVSVYTSATGEWSAPASIELSPYSALLAVPSILAGGSLFFNVANGILKYDLEGRQPLSVIKPPPHFQDMGVYIGDAMLMIAEDGELGVANVQGRSIHIWSRRAACSGIAGWVQSRVIELDNLIPMAIDDLSVQLSVVGFTEATGTLFIGTNAGIFASEVKSGQVRKVADSGEYYVIFPFVSFYTPDK
ncbi:hypothetical protein BS78_02G015500 [Paspalum vaginatum]|nr:hypothetical protein BS78_02G015500 [Paspalum vaginatum]